MPWSAGDVQLRFERIFGAGGRVHVIRAPGRVNLIGEHVDYNDGLVFPMAIEPEVRIACRARNDARIRLASAEFPGRLAEFQIDYKIEKSDPSWANYSRGIAAQLIAAGIPLVGMEALICNTLPVGAGLSSSAAILVGTGLALLTLAGLEMDRSRLALLAQKAEHEFAGVPVGIMDQTIVAGATAGHAMLLDCRDKSQQFIEIDPKDLRVLIVNSMAKHELSGSEYVDRRAECEEGVAFFQTINPAITSLRDVPVEQVEASQGKLSDVVFRRCRHVVTEIARTALAATSLRSRYYDEVGAYMLESHRSLRDDYEVSTPELDFLVDTLSQQRGVYGARMTGAGFGGCAIALTQPRQVEAISQQITTAYQQKFKITPELIATQATAGASVLEE